MEKKQAFFKVPGKYVTSFDLSLATLEQTMTDV